MNVAILIMVTFLTVVDLVALLGYQNVRARNDLAKKIARELHDLSATERAEAK